MFLPLEHLSGDFSQCGADGDFAVRGGMGNAPRGGTGHMGSHRVPLLTQPSRGSPPQASWVLQGSLWALGPPSQGPPARTEVWGQSFEDSSVQSWTGGPSGGGAGTGQQPLVQLRFSARRVEAASCLHRLPDDLLPLAEPAPLGFKQNATLQNAGRCSGSAAPLRGLPWPVGAGVGWGSSGVLGPL